jgi:Mn-dependent DtxR family transcriptional regulator
MYYPAGRRAERLLREMGRQAESKADPIVEPEAAAERLKMSPDSPLTEEALGRLMESGYLERTQHPALGTAIGAYQLTEEGEARAKELSAGE